MARAGNSKLFVRKTSDFPRVRVGTTDPAKAVGVILNALGQPQPHDLVTAPAGGLAHGAGLQPVDLEIGFGARNKEGTHQDKVIELLKTHIPAIHHIERAEFDNQFVQKATSACFPWEIAIIVGMGPRKSSNVCSLTAALAERKRAHGNKLRHRSIVVESSA